MVVHGSTQSSVMVYGGLWWSMVVRGGPQQPTVVLTLHQSVVGTKGTAMPACPGELMPMRFPSCFPCSQ